MDHWDEFRIERSMLRIGTFLSAKRNCFLRERGLTASQSEALLFLNENPGISITNLRKYLKISHQAARVLVGRLKEKGFVSVRPDEADSRSRLIALTEQGSILIAQLKLEGQSAGVRLLQTLSHDEMVQLDAILKKISESMQAEQA